MSIQARCPNCDASYNLAELQRGKKVRCRKCSDTFVVGEKNNEAPASASRSGKLRKDGLQTSPVPPPKTPPPKVKSVAPPVRRDRDLDRDMDRDRDRDLDRDRDRDDEEEDDLRDRPEPRKKSGSPVPLILMIGGGVLLLLLLAGGAVVACVFLFAKKATTEAIDNVVKAADPDSIHNVDEASAIIRTATTADAQNKAADWLAAATVTADKRKDVAALLETLAGNLNTRDAALRALAQWAGPEDIPTLLRAADDDKYWGFGPQSNEAANALVRLKADGAAAIFARRLPTARGPARELLTELCQTGDPAVIKAVEREVLRYFDNPNNEVRSDAQDLLKGGCGTKPETLFNQALVDMRSREKGYAQWACDYVGRQPVDPARQAEVAQALEAALGGDGETRTAAVNALATWATKDSIPALIGELDHADTFGNGDFPACLDALVRLKDERGAEAIAKHLKNGFQRKQVYPALLAMGKVAEKAVAAYVNDADPEVADDANKLIKAYGTGGAIVFDATIKDLNAKDGKQRRAACDALAAQAVDPAHQEEVARALDKLLEDEDTFFNRVPEGAAKALGVWGDKKSGTALLIAMQKPNGDLWQPCVDALVQLKDERVVFPLIALIEKKDIFHKDAAVKALNQLGPTFVETALDDALVDPNASVSDKLAICVHLNLDVGTKASLPALQTAAMDPNAQVKNAATGAINAIKKRNP